MYEIQEAASKVGISEGLLILWISTKRIVPSIELRTANSDIFEKYPGLKNYADKNGELFGWNRYVFSDADIERLRSIVESPTVKRERQKLASWNPKADSGTHYTVKELAAAWAMSDDTIRRLFENEPDAVALGNKNPRGKRRRVTLRIPHHVAVRVHKKISII